MNLCSGVIWPVQYVLSCLFVRIWAALYAAALTATEERRCYTPVFQFPTSFMTRRVKYSAYRRGKHVLLPSYINCQKTGIAAGVPGLMMRKHGMMGVAPPRPRRRSAHVHVARLRHTCRACSRWIRLEPPPPPLLDARLTIANAFWESFYLIDALYRSHRDRSAVETTFCTSCRAAAALLALMAADFTDRGNCSVNRH